MYRVDSVIDLTLKVSDLLITGSDRWNRNLVFQTFTVEDAAQILCLKPKIAQEDTYRWGFTDHGVYSTQSGYRLTEAILELNTLGNHTLSPIEKKIWSDLWKVKAPPKLKHFLWRALSGALAVKERLQTRGILIDNTCLRCGLASETICHVLFTCNMAHEAWELANIPMPQAGFSRYSVFLNLVHVISVSKNHNADDRIRHVFPWLLWQIWKARNSLVFNKLHVNPHNMVAQAYEEAELWQQAQSVVPESEEVRATSKWCKPPQGSIKCNIGSSWNNSAHPSGAAWILRDHNGSTIMHSRRAYYALPPKRKLIFILYSGQLRVCETFVSTRSLSNPRPLR